MKVRLGGPVPAGLVVILALAFGLQTWVDDAVAVPLATPVSDAPMPALVSEAAERVPIDDRRTITVIDDVTERPIAKALLLPDAGERCLDPARSIAMADQEGRIVLPGGELPARVCVAAAGYVAAEFLGAEAGAAVRLQPASRVDVRGEFEDGSPAAGAVVSLARTALAAEAWPAGSGLPRPGAAGIGVGVTDATGWVSLDGLEAGTWWSTVTSEGAWSEQEPDDGVHLSAGQRATLRLRLRRLVGFEATVLGGECVAHRLAAEAGRYEAAGANMQQVVRSTWLLHRATPAGAVRDAWLIGAAGMQPGSRVEVDLLIAGRGWVRRAVECSLWTQRVVQVIDVSAAAQRVAGRWFSWSGDAIAPVRVLLASGELLWVEPGQRTWLPAGEHRIADAFGNDCDPDLIAVADGVEPLHAKFGYGNRHALLLDVRMQDGSKPLWATASFRRMLTEQVGGDSSAAVWYGRTCRVFEAGTERVLVRAGLLGGDESDREVVLAQPVTPVQLTLRYP
ncbi:MAG: hypothetical protein IPK26_31250 [Planctomycetes bacterium]|nr:hypothetical protein [Planctomycetota bacterium]